VGRKASLLGQTLWRFKTNSPIVCSPSFDTNLQRLITGAEDGVVYSIDASSGNEVWRFPTAGAIRASVSIDCDSRCFIGSEDGFLYVLDGHAGVLLWKRKISNSRHSEPLLFGDMVVSAGDSKLVVALEVATGEVRWLAALRGPHVGGAALVAELWSAIGRDAGKVDLLDRESVQTVWTFDTGGSIRSPSCCWRQPLGAKHGWPPLLLWQRYGRCRMKSLVLSR